ncbi:MAG: hypothetical protein QM753_15165 [Thermomicrobiales bacterium]
MRLRRGVLAVGLMILSVTSVTGALASEGVDGAAEPLPTIEAPVSSTVEPTALPTGTVAPEPELMPAHVVVWLCEEAKCPEPTQIVSGVEVGVVDGSGQQIAGCVTGGDPAGCELGVPVGESWNFTWNDATIPAGYVFDSVATVTGGGWEGEAYILQFVPAPDEPQVETVHVGVMLCADASCTDGEMLAGIGVASVNANTNAQVDNCETAGDPAVCAIDVPLYAPWSLTWDSTAIPDGYRYIGELEVVVTERGDYPVLYLVRLVPESVSTVTPTVSPLPTKVPVSGLPKTGAGEDGSAGDSPAVAILALAAAGLAGLGVAASRRRSA